MMRCILDENLIDDLFIEMRTENYLILRNLLLQVDLDHIETITGVDKRDIARAARTYARAQRSTICYCLGVTQHTCGTANVKSYANLAMLTGHVEQEFTGVDPLRGQGNVQGACDLGALPAVLPGYQSVFDPRIREQFEIAWKRQLPDTPGMTVVDMTHGHGTDPLRALFVVGENPMLSDPVLGQVHTTLEALEFLVVADIFLTETAELADVVLPTACFAEKTGTITNTERRVQLMHKAVEPPGEAQEDSWIIQELSTRMGYPMTSNSTAEIMEEICMLTPIYGGMYHDRLDGSWGLQWPCPNRDHPGTPFLHKYSFTRGSGRFEPEGHSPPAEPADHDYPFILITGRSYHHYHTGTMTRRSAALNREHSIPLLDIHPKDAEKLGLKDGSRVRVNSRRGSVPFTLHCSEQMALGEVSCDFHFHEAPTNFLTLADSDPIAHCPEYKCCAVKVEADHD
jgi:formate dehydrogenase major subunit/formate dehydrogenase alpha subunit